MEYVILVDENDVAIGEMEKMEAHKRGLLHRAVSVFIINTKGEILLQRRALSKYHSGGLWTNTCCTHPRANESSLESANRRLKEEMGMVEDLREVFSFTYRAELDNDMIEHEFDHVFIGFSDAQPKLNPVEACDYKWMGMSEIQESIQMHPEDYTEWFKIIFRQFQNELGKELSMSIN